MSGICLGMNTSVEGARLKKNAPRLAAPASGPAQSASLTIRGGLGPTLCSLKGPGFLPDLFCLDWSSDSDWNPCQIWTWDPRAPFSR